MKTEYCRQALAIVFLLFIGILSQAQTFKNLVFEGGGVRGIAYCGALDKLNEEGLLDDVDRVAGTSAGAITATLFALGYSTNELKDIIYYTNFGDFNDGEYMFVGGTKRVLENYGWYKGDEFIYWLESYVAKKTGNKDITFVELHKSRMRKGYADLYITGTNLTKQEEVIFSFETYPDMRIVDAVRISMSVPLWFEAVVVDSYGHITSDEESSGDGQIMIDGGLLSNFPIKIFDDPKYISGISANAFAGDFCNSETLGFRLDSKEQIIMDEGQDGLVEQNIDDMEDYVTALYIMIIENLNRQNLCSEDWDRTVSIDTMGIGPKVKKLSEDEKKMLIQSGADGIEVYLKKYWE